MRKVIFIFLILLAGYSIYRFNFWQMNYSVSDLITENLSVVPQNSILVLPGSGRAYTERPNFQFNGRVNKAAEILIANRELKVIVSGLHDGREYAETRDFATALINKGVDAERISYDSSAHDTFQTILNLKRLDTRQKFIFVSQREHLARTLWMARISGLSSMGVVAPGWPGGTPQWRITRERLAALKARFNIYYYLLTGKRTKAD